MKYALIGEKLSHSYSKTIHGKMGLDYSLVELKREDVKDFVLSCPFDGFNVTVPYKKEVIPYLDDISPEAKSANAVNTVKIKDGKKIGYNTDIAGMRYMIRSSGVKLKDKVVMILGSGGTSGTARALCALDGAKKVYVVSRSGEINYDNCYSYQDAEIIINATPVGTYPNVDGNLLDLKKFDNLLGVYDCVYNPWKTKLLQQAETQGIPFSGGLPMLVTQAIKAEEIWLDKDLSDNIPALIKELSDISLNIILTGMPSSGKTTVGKLIARKLGREFLDVDAEIEKQYASPAKLINEYGEDYFRDVESKVVKELVKSNGKVIALGGGSVLREQNVSACKQNGRIVYIDRDVSLLVDVDRPISQKVGIRELYERRKPIYESVADLTVNGNSTPDTVAENVIKALGLSSC